MVEVRPSKTSLMPGAVRNRIAPPRYAGEFLSRKNAVSGVSAYFEFCLVRKPKRVSESHRMRMPRTGHWQRDATSSADNPEAPMVLNTPRSTAAFSAAVLWYALTVSKKRLGFGGEE